MSDKLNIKNGTSGGPVECLGMSFPSENVRRDYFRGVLADKLKDPSFRSKEGFPDGTDEEILNLSDPPYFTACPNPFISRFIEIENSKAKRTETIVLEPFAADVSEGKSDPI